MTEKRFTLEEFGLNFIVKDNGRNLTAKQTVDKLNQLYDENEQLKSEIGNLEHTKDFCADVCADCERLEKENEQLKKRNDKQYNQLKQLWELIEDEDYNTLRSMLNQRETDEKLLQKEWGTYSD